MMTNEEMNWFLRGGKRPEPALPSKAPVACDDNNETCPDDDDQKTYLVKVSQVKKCLWEGYVEVQAGSKLEAVFKARDEFDTCGLDSWDLVDPELGSEDGSDDEPVFTIEESET